MANTLITNDLIAKLILLEFKNNLVLAKTARRQYQSMFSVETGATIRIRKPTRLVSQEGAVLSGVQPIQQRYTNLTIDRRRVVPIALTSFELSLQLDDFQEQVIRPAMQTLANDVDSSLYEAGVGAIYNYVGNAGTSPASFAVIDQANSKLNAMGIPKDKRYLIMSEKDGGAARSALYNTFNTNFNKDIILDSSMGRVAGFEAYTAQNVRQPEVLSTGVSFGTPLVKGAGQTGSTLLVDGVTSGITIKKGTVFQIAGVNSVNPISYNDTTYDANFVVTENCTAVGTDITLVIEPGIVTSGPYRNVTVGPADNAAITFQAKHTKNIAYHQEAFTLAMIDIYSPPAGENTGAYFKNLVDKSANVALRMVRQYNATTDEDLVRVDAMWGCKCFGEYGSIVMGS